MSSGFEDSYIKIMNANERRVARASGRSIREAITSPTASQPQFRERRTVPDEFLQPQPAMTRPRMGVFMPISKRKGRK